MPTVQQIEDFRRKARSKGYSEIQIANEIARKIKIDNASNIKSKTPDTGLDETTKAAPKEDKGFFANVGETLIRPLANYGKFVGEAIGQGVRAAVDPNIDLIDRKGGTLGKKNKESDALFKKNMEIIKKAKETTDPEEKKRLLQESRDISSQIEAIGESARKTGDLKPTLLLDEKQISSRGEIAKTGLKATAGAASYAIPVGTTLKGAAALGAVSGALFGLSEGEDISIDNIIGGAVGGAVGGAAIHGIGSLFKKAKGGFTKLIGKGEEKLSDIAASHINKATPAQWGKAVEEHGLNLNNMTKKYFPEGGSYDDLLGAIDKRGKGGILKDFITKAEKQISKEFKAGGSATKIPVDDMIKELTKERNSLVKLPGNENNIKALDAFIEGFKARYGKGISPTRLLELKRIADSKFGQAVADETVGSATAQAQKMIANAGRAKLKQLFPKVADALETEMEVYTIQPIMNRARAILNTTGSEIRAGSLKGSVLELLNPFNLADAYLADPRRASKFLKATGKAGEEIAAEAVGKTGQELKNLFSTQFFGRLGGSAIGANIGEEDQQPTDQGDNANADQNGGQDIVPPDSSITKNEPMNLFGGKTKKQLLQEAFLAGANSKQLKEIGDIYDTLAPEDDGATLELSDSAIKNVTDLQGAISDVSSLTQEIGDSNIVGVISGLRAKNPLDVDARALQAEIDRVRQVVGKALEGGVLRKEDEEKYKKILPVMTDSKEVALRKLKQLDTKLKLDIKNYVEAQRLYGKGRGAENILNSL